VICYRPPRLRTRRLRLRFRLPRFVVVTGIDLGVGASLSFATVFARKPDRPTEFAYLYSRKLGEAARFPATFASMLANQKGNGS